MSPYKLRYRVYSSLWEIHRRLIALAIDFNRVIDENYEQLSSSSQMALRIREEKNR